MPEITEQERIRRKVTMHMADALVSPAVAGTMYTVSAAAAAYSVKKIKLEDLDSKVPAMILISALWIGLPGSLNGRPGMIYLKI